MTKAQRARNPAMLLKVVCEEFRVHDKYQRGIISSSAFARVFSDLNLEYGGAEADVIMKYVTVTNDGFVHYKTLMQQVAPKHTAAGSSIDKAISPELEPQVEVEPLRYDARNVSLMNPTQRRQFIIDRTEAIRKIYSEWDRGSVDNLGFKRRLTEIGIPISEELHRIIDLHDNSRALSFGKVIQALQIGDYMQHKARDPEALTTWSPLPRMHRAQIAPRNPVSWQDPVEARPGDAIDDGSLRHYISRAQDGDVLAELKAVICAYMVGSIPTVEFVAHLDRHGVPITQELQRLLRQQQCDNRATFRDYVKAIFPKRTEFGDDEVPGMLAYLAGVQGKPATMADAQQMMLANEPREEELGGEMGGPPSEYEQGYEGYPPERDEGYPPEYGEEEDLQLEPIPPKAPPQLSKQKARLYGGYGDIIAWNDTPEPAKSENVRVHRDFVSNPSIISHQEPESSPAQKPRRFLQQPRPVPFGTDADIGVTPAPIQPSSGQMRRGYRGDRW